MAETRFTTADAVAISSDTPDRLLEIRGGRVRLTHVLGGDAADDPRLVLRDGDTATLHGGQTYSLTPLGQPAAMIYELGPVLELVDRPLGEYSRVITVTPDDDADLPVHGAGFPCTAAGNLHFISTGGDEDTLAVTLGQYLPIGIARVLADSTATVRILR